MESLRHIRKRVRRCYELAWKAIAHEPGAEKFLLVHGTIEPTGCPIDHAWIGLPDQGMIYDPVLNQYFSEADYIAERRAIAQRMYTQDEAMDQLALSGHYGPWHGDFDPSRIFSKRKGTSFISLFTDPAKNRPPAT